jgi:anti-sigma factor RsiW
MNEVPDGDTTAELEDLIARHFDGGLEAEDQRQLARRLADSPEARRTFSRYLRLEAATFRLAAARQLAAAGEAGDHGSVVSAAAARAGGDDHPAPGRPWLQRRRLATIAMAGGLLAAVLLVSMLVPWAGSGEPRGSEIDLLAEQWLRLQGTTPPEEVVEASVAPADEAFAATALADAPDADDPEPVGAPPSWLVAAMADTETAATTPDEG